MREGERRGRRAFRAEDAASDAGAASVVGGGAASVVGVGAATVVCEEAVACG
jgi:hypothetical protein